MLKIDDELQSKIYAKKGDLHQELLLYGDLSVSTSRELIWGKTTPFVIM